MDSVDRSAVEELFESRFAALEDRLAALEDAAGLPNHSPEAPTGQYWVLDGLRQGPDIPDGSVIFAGAVEVGQESFSYQWQRPTKFLLDAPWDDQLTRLGALAHPVRGEILRRLLASPATIAELVDEEVVTSTGTGYHHVGALQAAGWVHKAAGGAFAVKPARVVPLLTIIAAAEDH